MTPQGRDALEAELKQLVRVDRPKISAEIGAAREHGDLRENAEYHAAKEKQGQVEARIRHLEEMLASAEVIEPAAMSGARVKFGARVKLEEVESGRASEYRLVGMEEADIAKGTISISSPLARALINHEVGDEIRVKTPGGTRVYEIVDINWD